MIQRRDKKRTASAKRIQAAFLEDNHIDIEEIPPKEEYVRDTVNKQLRVCAYCRVSTDEESQQSSYELQVQHYTEYINKHDNWTLVGVYADEGISGTSVNHRVQFLQMIQDAEDGKIDMIVTKSISRFARNTLDCISYVRRLKALKPPVGVFFEMNGYNTLDTISETFLTLLSTVAPGESEAKSEALKWSYRQRFKKGIPVNNMWAIMGYDTDENGKIFIIEKEAEIVRFMFTAYLEGKSTVEIAEALTMAEIPTPKGNARWQPGTVAGMLHNEKYCGEMRMQKTVTVDLFSHKSVKNEGIVSQYRMKNYHPAIVSRKVYEDVQERFLDGGNRARHTKEPKIKVKFKPIKSGLLTGFVPIPSAVEKIDIEQLKEISKKTKIKENKKMLKGFKVISVYGNTSESTVTVTSKYFKFNADTAAELGYPKYIQMLIDADNKKFAIQATDAQGANSIEFKVSEPSESGKKSVINVAFKAAHATIVQLKVDREHWQREIQ